MFASNNAYITCSFGPKIIGNGSIDSESRRMTNRSITYKSTSCCNHFANWEWTTNIKKKNTNAKLFAIALNVQNVCLV